MLRSRLLPHRPALRFAAPLLCLLAACSAEEPAVVEVVQMSAARSLEPEVAALLAELVGRAQAVPSDPVGHGVLGLAYEANGLESEAARSYTNAVLLGARDPWLYRLATAQLGMGDLEAACVSLRSAADERPDEAWIRARLGSLLFDEGRIDEAAAECAAAEAATPWQPECLAALARVRLFAGEGDARAAARLLEEALALDPDYDGARTLLAAARGVLDGGDLPAGLVDVELHVGDPNQADLWTYGVGFDARLAQAEHWVQAGEAEAALAVLRGLPTRRPVDPAILNRLAVVHADLDQPELALELLRESERADPDRARTQIELCYLMIGLGRDEEAAGYAARGLELAPENGECHYLQAIFLWPSDPEEAMRAGRAARRNGYEEPELLALLAQVHGYFERPVEMKRCAEKAVLGMPDNPLAYLLLAQAHLLGGDRAEAAATVARAKQLAPDDARVLEMEQTLSRSDAQESEQR